MGHIFVIVFNFRRIKIFNTSKIKCFSSKEIKSITKLAELIDILKNLWSLDTQAFTATFTTKMRWLKLKEKTSVTNKQCEA